MDELEKFKVGATPTFFINGMHVGGALPKQAFKQIIDEKLKVAEASASRAATTTTRDPRQGREAVPLEEGSEAELSGAGYGRSRVPFPG